jgi:hypothetical protein
MIVCVCFNTNCRKVKEAMHTLEGQGRSVRSCSPLDVLHAAGAPIDKGNCMQCVPMTRQMKVDFVSTCPVSPGAK